MADSFAGLTLKDLDDQIVDRAKIAILDAIAVAYAGHKTDTARIVCDIFSEFPAAKNSATVWFKGLSSNYIFAAVSNCALVHNMIHDDMNESSRGHAGNLIVPSVLAIAEAYDRPGDEVVPAIVVGYEAMGRVAKPAVAHSVGRGFRGTSTYGPFGVAAAASKILKLNAVETANAIAGAASFSLGLLEPFNTGSMEWRFQNSVVIMGGMMAALTAKNGARSAATALEGDGGFISAFCGNEVKDEVVSAWMAESKTLGKEYDISKTYFKPYSTCGYNQIGCNIALNVIKKHSLTADMLKEIIVKVSPDNKAYPGVDFNGPFATPDLALLSKPFMLGAAVVTRDLQIDTYQSRLNDPEILKVAKMVRLESDLKMTPLDTEIRFITKDGQVFAGDLRQANLEAFINNRGLAVQKFHSLAGGSIDSQTIDEIAEMVFNIEDLKTVSDLTAKLKRL